MSHRDCAICSADDQGEGCSIVLRLGAGPAAAATALLALHRRAVREEGRLLMLPFTTVLEYLALLQVVSLGALTELRRALPPHRA